MGVELLVEDAQMTALLSGDIDHHTAKEIRESIDAKAEECKPHILNLDFQQVRMLLLEEVNMRNNRLARNGDNGNVATLDLSGQGRLKKLDGRGTGLTRVKLATGAPVVQLCLPDTIEELFLEYLTKLSDKMCIRDRCDVR